MGIREQDYKISNSIYNLESIKKTCNIDPALFLQMIATLVLHHISNHFAYLRSQVCDMEYPTHPKVQKKGLRLVLPNMYETQELMSLMD